jgi:antirestriction factor ArdC-like protein
MNATKGARREEMQQEALSRAIGGQALTNWPAIIHGFTAKGIPESDILPRENVFTYHAWRALGRQVRRGEHGVKVVTFVPVGDRTDGQDDTERERPVKRRGGSRPWSATVFHITQTDPLDTER